MCPQAGCFPWSRPMPHTHQNVGQGGKLSEYSDVFNLADTIADVLTNHNKAAHDALAINSDQVDGEEAAAIVTEARVGAVLTKAIVDALAVNAGQVDGVEGAEILQRDGSVPLTVSWPAGPTRNIAVGVIRTLLGGSFAVGEEPAWLRIVHDTDEVAKILGVSNAIAGLKISKAIIGAFELNTLIANNKVPDSDTVDAEHAAAITTNARVKAHFPDTIANILSNHTKAVHDALALALGSLTADVACRAYRNALQAIPDDTITKVAWDAENFDIGGNFAGGTFTAPSTGLYLIESKAQIAMVAAGTLTIYIYVNGAVVATNCVKHGGAINDDVHIMTLHWVTGGHTVEIYVRQDSGAAKNLQNSTEYSWVNIVKIGQ